MRYRLFRALFVVSLFGEMFLLTSQRLRYMGNREVGIVIILLGADMGVFAILSSFDTINSPERSQNSSWENRLLQIVALCGIALSAFHFNREISVVPIDEHISDILPTIQVMNHRLLSGQYPYDLIQSFGYDLSPTYLPLMWMPFLPATLLHFDERWMAFIIWAVATLAMIRRIHIQAMDTEAKWLITALPFFLFILIEESTDSTYANTVELMIAGFYMLFALQLVKIKSYLTAPAKTHGPMLAFFIVLCLLSRYSFLLWLPLCFIIVWIENRKLALYVSAWVLGLVTLLFVLPFLIKDPMIYFNGLKHYSKAALGVWSEPGDKGVLHDGLGVAGIFRDDLGWEMADRLAALQRCQFIASLAVTAICCWVWWKKRFQLQNLPLFLLGSLQLYFAIFYGFIQVPYTYLMVMPVFFSIVVLLPFYKKA